MRSVVFAKFAQHRDLRKVLLSTGNARIVESATVDNLVNRTWGEVNGHGKNMLGEILMETRQILLEIDLDILEESPQTRNVTNAW